MTVDHMESQEICGVKSVDYTRCGKKVNSTPGYVFEYGSTKTTCKACLRLYAKDLAEAEQKPRRKFKCIRTDCGRSGCESSVSYSHPDPEFCLYDFDEAHWDEVKGGDDK